MSTSNNSESDSQSGSNSSLHLSAFINEIPGQEDALVQEHLSDLFSTDSRRMSCHGPDSSSGLSHYREYLRLLARSITQRCKDPSYHANDNRSDSNSSNNPGMLINKFGKMMISSSLTASTDVGSEDALSSASNLNNLVEQMKNLALNEKSYFNEQQREEIDAFISIIEMSNQITRKQADLIISHLSVEKCADREERLMGLIESAKVLTRTSKNIYDDNILQDLYFYRKGVQGLLDYYEDFLSPDMKLLAELSMKRKDLGDQMEEKLPKEVLEFEDRCNRLKEDHKELSSRIQKNYIPVSNISASSKKIKKELARRVKPEYRNLGEKTLKHLKNQTTILLRAMDDPLGIGKLAPRYRTPLRDIQKGTMLIEEIQESILDPVEANEIIEGVKLELLDVLGQCGLYSCN